MPKGSYIGEIPTSMLADLMPQQFLPDYDYNFLYYLRSQLIPLQNCAQVGDPIIAHSVIEELLIYLIMKEAEYYLTEIEDITKKFEEAEDILSEWSYIIFYDSDILFLFEEYYFNDSHCYHFSHWNEKQFYMDDCS